MENAVNNRIRRIIKAENITQEIFCTIIGIPLSTLKTSFQRDSNPNFELMHGVAENFPAYSMDWLITGKGDMYKKDYNSERDNNVVEGDNEDIIDNTETNVQGNDFVEFLKNKIEELKQDNDNLITENKLLTYQNGYYKALLDQNGVSYNENSQRGAV